MPELKEILTNSYRNTVITCFEKNILSYTKNLKELPPNEQEEALYQISAQYANEKLKLVEKWATEPLEELQGSAPAQAIGSLTELDEVFEIFTHMASTADDDPPFMIIAKLREFGGDTVSKLYQLAMDNKEGELPAEYLFAAAVLALGIIKLDGCVDTLIELAYQIQQEPQLEHIEEALKNCGESVIEPILKRLQNNEFGNVETMLLYVLAHSGSKAKDDRIYRMLRKAFRTIENKMHAILCFSVYGDGRAVPMLRSYLEKNGHNLPERVYHEIVGAIRNLGGETEDFMQSHHHHH